MGRRSAWVAGRFSPSLNMEQIRAARTATPASARSAGGTPQRINMPRKRLDRGMRFSIWVENKEMIKRGYKRMDLIKYGPHAGKPGWYHPGTREVVPDEEVANLHFNQPVDAPADEYKDGKPKCSACGRNDWKLSRSHQGIDEYVCGCGNKFEDRMNMVKEFMNKAKEIQALGLYFMVKQHGGKKGHKSGSLRAWNSNFVASKPAKKATKRHLEAFANQFFASALEKAMEKYDPNTELFRKESPVDLERYKKIGALGSDTLYLVVPSGPGTLDGDIP
jgi:hypothetical protein